ncbi:MAG TPA: SDR family NAD(P)-dependent oxidoreductase [Terriglobales bacterium]|jgi:NAD(P)-dependent dehydrogenase (short-subunit alcohol dehydrogenase family)|nr:SDR family NAD(P)-dependent oxidoreductase [Terriglobales bacterium]
MAQQKIAVVTGSSSGIGLVTCVELARNGYRVIATMRDLGRSGRLEDAATKASVRDRLDLRRVDITETDSLPGAVDAIVRDHQRIDVLVNNAGFAASGFVEDITLTELRHQMETNFFGNVAMTKAVLPLMRRQRSGHIIQIASVGGRASAPLLSCYNASKFALEGWSEALRIETHSLGIRVALIEPGDYDTDIWTRNVVIGKQAMNPSSPNRERSQRFAEFVKARAPNRRDPREVARLIVRVANHPNQASLSHWSGRENESVVSRSHAVATL